MDKEKNNNIENNIDDVLKHLKNTYENQSDPLPDTKVVFENDKSDELSPEDISERLRQAFMSGKEYSTEEKSEYAIDDSIMSEFIDEQKEIKEEEVVLAEEEVDEDSEAPMLAEEETDEVSESPVLVEEDEGSYEKVEDNETVEIIIPFIESMVSELKSAEEQAQKEAAEQENYDFYEEENAENSYICFADYEANDDEIFGDSENKVDSVIDNEDDELDELMSDDDFDDVDEIDEEFDNVGDDDDDLPWYTDDELPSSNRTTLIGSDDGIFVARIEEDIDLDENAQVQETKEDIGEVAQSIAVETVEETSSASEEKAEQFIVEESLEEPLQLPEDEETVALINEIIGDTVEETIEETIEETLAETIEETVEHPSVDTDERTQAYSVFSEENTLHSPRRVDDEKSSFYRTIIDARDERERLYGYSYTNYTSEEEQIEDNSPIEIIDGGSQVEEIELPLDMLKEAQPIIDQNHEIKDSDPQITFDESTVVPEKDTVAVPDKTEDINANQEVDPRDRKLARFLRFLKRVAMGVLTLGIFLLELMPVLNIVPDGFLDYTAYPVSYILIDAQLLIFLVALFYEKLYDGLLKLFTPFANFYSVLSVTVLATLLSGVLSCFFTNDDAPRLYNFISAAYLSALYIFESLESRHRRKSIKLLANEKVFALKRSQGSNSSAEKMYAGGMDPDKSIFEPVEIETKDFRPAFVREKAEGRKSFANSVVISATTPIIIFATIITVMSIVFERGLYASFNALSFVFVTTAPFAAMIAYYLPLFVSYRRLIGRGCVITGYEGASMIADCDAVVFSDTHLFKECEAKEAGIKLYCDENMTRQLFVSLACVYSKIDGPMKNTFVSILGDQKHKVSIIRITRNGFEAVVDNQMNLIVGSAQYLGRYGIFVKKDANDDDTGVIYAALNSTLCAKINVFYRTQPIFEAVAEILDSCKTKTVIETYDPVITGKYVARCRGEASFPISVVHKNINDYNTPQKTTSSLGRAGAFATSSRLKLAELISFCKGLGKVRFINTWILIGSYALSGLLCTLFVINGTIEQTNMLWVLLYQLALVGAYTFTSIKLLPLSFDGIQEKKRKAEIRNREKENIDQI